jgi:hypothetical protein
MGLMDLIEPMLVVKEVFTSYYNFPKIEKNLINRLVL